VVASLQRWWANDAFGQALAAATDELSAPSDKTVQFRLKHRFDLLPQALAHPTNLVAAIMPERLARTPPDTRLTEIVGSGPFRYVAAERVAGARNVYAKFERYNPRPNGSPSFCAGPRIAYFDRVEWLTTPDPATQVAALQSGEVDWVEQPLMDLVGSLRRNEALKVEVAETKGLIGFLRFNQLFPPFDNPAIRRAVLSAVNQKDLWTPWSATTPATTRRPASSLPVPRWRAMPACKPWPAHMIRPRSRPRWRKPATRARRSSTSPSTTCRGSTPSPKSAPTCCARSA
jgi:peptide/nickel transport system substrate-binding protein